MLPCGVYALDRWLVARVPVVSFVCSLMVQALIHDFVSEVAFPNIADSAYSVQLRQLAHHISIVHSWDGAAPKSVTVPGTDGRLFGGVEEHSQNIISNLDIPSHGRGTPFNEADRCCLQSLPERSARHETTHSAMCSSKSSPEK